MDEVSALRQFVIRLSTVIVFVGSGCMWYGGAGSAALGILIGGSASILNFALLAHAITTFQLPQIQKRFTQRLYSTYVFRYFCLAVLLGTGFYFKANIVTMAVSLFLCQIVLLLRHCYRGSK